MPLHFYLLMNMIVISLLPVIMHHQQGQVLNKPESELNIIACHIGEYALLHSGLCIQNNGVLDLAGKSDVRAILEESAKGKMTRPSWPQM